MAFKIVAQLIDQLNLWKLTGCIIILNKSNKQNTQSPDDVTQQPYDVDSKRKG